MRIATCLSLLLHGLWIGWIWHTQSLPKHDVSSAYGSSVPVVMIWKTRPPLPAAPLPAPPPPSPHILSKASSKSRNAPIIKPLLNKKLHARIKPRPSSKAFGGAPRLSLTAFPLPKGEQSSRMRDSSSQNQVPISKPIALKDPQNHTPPPIYPSRARRLGLEGVVFIQATVTPQGYIRHCRLDQSSGHPVLDAVVCPTVTQWRVQPAMRQGEAFEDTIRISFTFRLTEEVKF